MFTLTALFIASWIAIALLGSQGYSLDETSKPGQAQSWNSPALQPIAIPVTPDQRFAKR